MKVLFVGTGSIGKRHIRDFYKECMAHGIAPEIHVLRRNISDLGDIERYISKQILEISEKDYDVAFITNPTSLHFEALRKCKGLAKWYFVEKPIFDNTKYDISCLEINSSNTYVAAPMRHTVLYKKLKEVVDANPVYSVRAICSSYLPDWRNGVDYRTVYSAKKEMGGGVNTDLIHEIDYIYDLFGNPISVYGISGKYSSLDITSNDLATYLFRYEDKICEIHLDYFGRTNRRTCEIFTPKGTYIADFYKETLTKPEGEIVDCHIMQNEEYINEMAYFYRFISGKEKSINSPDLAMRTLQIALEGDVYNVR